MSKKHSTQTSILKDSLKNGKSENVLHKKLLLKRNYLISDTQKIETFHLPWWKLWSFFFLSKTQVMAIQDMGFWVYVLKILLKGQDHEFLRL